VEVLLLEAARKYILEKLVINEILFQYQANTASVSPASVDSNTYSSVYINSLNFRRYIDVIVIANSPFDKSEIRGYVCHRDHNSPSQTLSYPTHSNLTMIRLAYSWDMSYFLKAMIDIYLHTVLLF
jgi:hypothetical protein